MGGLSLAILFRLQALSLTDCSGLGFRNWVVGQFETQQQLRLASQRPD